jgi:hypothetical protein
MGSDTATNTQSAKSPNVDRNLFALFILNIKMKIITLSLLTLYISATGQTTNNFYPDGYYFTKPIIQNEQWNFAWLLISIKPDKNSKKSVSIRFENFKTGKWTDTETTDYFLTPTNVKITFKKSPVGTLSFIGHFIHPIPPIADKEVKALETIVFVGTGKINGKSFPVKFFWSEGD